MEVAETKVDGKIMQTGGSLPVENVQALAASKNLTEIPHWYIRSDVMADFLGTDAEEILIIDLDRLLDLASFEAEVTKLKRACEE